MQEMRFEPLHHAAAQGVGRCKCCFVCIELCAVQGGLHQSVVVHDLPRPA